MVTARVPVVLVAGSPGEPHADVFGVGNRAGIKAMVGHLVEQHGRTRLFEIAGPPPLTTVRQPMQVRGERACGRLPQRIAQPDLPRHVERLPSRGSYVTNRRRRCIAIRPSARALDLNHGASDAKLA
jgi:DNA-binding LacI/PurR family transcriptional regulator